MSDRELLEAAARAAGYKIDWSATSRTNVLPDPYAIDAFDWNPLENDGDALRLAVQLHIHVLCFENMATAAPLLAGFSCDERYNGDRLAATRRAIVRAAAEIGLKEQP